jgi:predicted HicB family RNase H-like nuclease
MFSYKGYVGSFTFDEKMSLFLGRVSNVNYPITFQGKSVESAKRDFKDAINEYLNWCKKYDKVPEKTLKLRYSSDLLEIS